MKFAIIALVAAASAITIRQNGGCVDSQMSDGIFKEIDTNHNGEVNKSELVTALKAFAKSQDYTPTDADWKWVAKHAKADAAKQGNKATMDPEEFNHFANQFAEHFGLCPPAGKPSTCVDQETAKQIFEHVDTNHNGTISENELVTALVAFAKQEGHQITDEDKAWVGKTAEADAAKNGHPNSMDPGEFFIFVNQFAHHYDMC